VAERYRVSAIVFDLDGVLVDSMPAPECGHDRP